VVTASVVRAREAVAAVPDPELPLVTIEELGILRSVYLDPDTGRVTVAITPTYLGCPALETIRSDVVTALGQAGYVDVEVMTVLNPAWSTDMITESGRAKLAAAGIAPPGPAGTGAVPLRLSVACPRCGSADTEELSAFGSTACKALWRCRACREPFERVKPL
jgi:ring-1,2-phenylacetyl-CoA epoxidase subunit PaaD